MMVFSGGSEAADSPDARSPGVAATASGVAGAKRTRDGEDGHQAQGSDGPGAKKKRMNSGNRGVANLTPEQLAKKRANDREAQRAIRERTKNQIETLERRIEELTNQKPYQELQAVVRAKEAVEQENADIKRQLASIISILKPIAGSVAETTHMPPTHARSQSQNSRCQSVSYSQPAAAVQSPGTHQYAAPTPAPSASPAANTEQPSQPQASPGWQDATSWPSNASPDTTSSNLQYQKVQLRQGLNMGGERLGLDFLLRPGQRIGRVQAGTHGAQDSPQYHHVPMKHDWAARDNERESCQSWTSPATPGPAEPSSHDEYRQAGTFQQQQQQQQQQQEQEVAHSSPNNQPYYAIPVKNSEPSCPLDVLLLNFLSERRQRIADGLPIQEVIGPRYPSVSSLLNPANSVYSHPLSKLFTDILAAFPDISRLPERVAVLYVMFLQMRWNISPTRENYELLPDWLAPRQSQLVCPHPAWIDYIPFPVMRERLARIYSPGEYDLDDFFIPFTSTLRVGWPYEETDALLVLPDSDEVVINPVFERHLRNIKNWTVGEAFARAFPALADTF